MGILVLADVGLRFWRLRSAFSSDDLISLFGLVFGIVVLWFSYFRHARALDRVPEQVSAKLVARLSTTASVMCMFGYMMLLEALLLQHR